jgi:Flp pilus assembly secretin CpaC
MRFFLTLALLSLLCSLHTRLSWATPPITGAMERPPLLIGEGEQRLLHEEGLQKYALGGSTVHAHSIGERGILIKGISPGLSDLWVWLKDGTTEHRSIRVEKVVAEEVKPALMRAIGQLQEAEVILSGNGVVIRGEIRSLAEVNRIAALLQGWPADVHDETEISDSLLNEAQLKIETWIQKSKNPSKVRVEIFDGVLWVRGSIENPTERSVVETRVRGLFPLVKTEIDSLPDAAPTVHFRVFLLELRKSRFSTLGLGWPSAQDGAFSVTTAAIQNLLQLNLTLNTLEGEGSVKILSSPELVVRAPGEAELFSGGEFPIQSQSAYYSSVTWKNFGLTLKLNVTHTSSEKVRLDIFTEVSHLDSSIASNSIPGLQTNRMKTQVDARYGVPLLLSGLLQNTVRENAKGLPFLRQIPVLGMLFGSDDYLNDRSELVAILVPSSTPPPAPISKLVRYSPKGSLPDPRTWISPEDEKRLRSSGDYPWNALQ